MSRTVQKLALLTDYELLFDFAVTSDGNLVHFALVAEVEPITFEDASTDEKNHTWNLVETLQDKRPIALRWIYKVKVNPKGEVVRHKARLVAKGYLQRASIDYGEVFAPIARLETIRVVVSLATHASWSMHHRCISEHGVYIKC